MPAFERRLRCYTCPDLLVRRAWILALRQARRRHLHCPIPRGSIVLFTNYYIGLAMSDERLLDVVLAIWLSSAMPASARLLALCLATAACSSGKPASDRDAAPPSPDVATPADASGVVDAAAAAVCRALFRCCDDDLELYFAPMREHGLLAAYRDRLPPTSEADCRAVVGEIFTITPFGDWVRAVSRGEVAYDQEAFGACLSALEGASCGASAREALWDSSCLGFAAPAGGTQQRSFFERTRKVGSSCSPLRDGVGAAFYGTCDPTTSFCCYSDPTKAGCQLPFDASGAPRTGSCNAVAATGAACSPFQPILLCATGEDCDADSATCVAPSSALLAVGASCIDTGYHSLGTCQGSWCDVLGTKRCEALREDGTTCTVGEECRSGLCRSVCVENTVCTSTPSGMGADAGLPDAPTPPDAPSVADGERCATALPLSSPDASPITTYDKRITSTLGATNDYNPLTSSGLPPACSVVYDAKGKDRVFAVTLLPGDRLRLRAELAGGKRAGMYLLDTCPGGSWPDFDGTGACGSNEYAAGACGALGCDPALLDITYPTAFTTSATFWVVIDQVDGIDAASFTLDWRVTHL
jgi:hypothetical protein